MREIWADVFEFEGLYQVSNLGKIRSVPKAVLGKGGSLRKLKGKIRKLHKMKDGRLTIQLWKENKQHPKYVHTLVLETFVGPRPEGMECCHFPDRDLNNCRLDNLRWDTSKGNKADQLVHGTRVCGEKNVLAKLKSEDIPVIRERLLRGDSGSKIARDYGVTPSVVSDIRRNKLWKHIPCADQHKNLGRGRKGTRGVDHGNAKLTNQDVLEIRKLYASGRYKQTDLAEAFGVCRLTVLRILNRQVWKHV